jgi:hypothetical protein
MQNELTAERIELAIKEIADVGMYGSQVHQETMETALAALRAEQERLNPQPLAGEVATGGEETIGSALIAGSLYDEKGL